ncbi:hypothetical protein Q3G72_002961 [Acer saccharum]|nr:hypothetical protein Q3G72_002961 [Acer saccharum]
MPELVNGPHIRMPVLIYYGSRILTVGLNAVWLPLSLTGLITGASVKKHTVYASIPIKCNKKEPIFNRNISLRRSVKMYTAKKKIQKDHDAQPTEFEETVAQALFDLENTNQELKSDLKDLYINQAIQMDVAGNRKAIVVYVPFRLRKAYDHKVHVRLVTMMWGCSLSLNCFVQSGLC